MRDWSLGARLAITFVVSFAATIAHAAADDILVMPYSCAVVDGKPVLTPSRDEHGHRIYGARERKKIETCSTVDSKRCRQWTAFKFDMDCGGERVAWMQVFANASEHTRRRVWEHNGRLRVRDTPMRNARIDDLCARRLGPQMEWSNTSELCDERSPLIAPTATNMPAGFAPMVGLDAAILSGEDFARLSARWARTGDNPRIGKAPTVPKQPSASSPKALAATDAPRAPASAPDTNPVETAAAPTPAVTPSAAAAAHVPPRAAPTAAAGAPHGAADEGSGPPPENADEPLATSAEPETAAQVEMAQSAPPPLPVAQSPSAAETSPRVLNTAQPSSSQPPAAEIPASTEKAVPAHVAATTPVTAEAVPPEAQSDHAVTYLIIALASGLLMVTLLGVHWLGTAEPSQPEAAPVGPEDDSVTAAMTPQAQPVIAETNAAPSAADNALIVIKPRSRTSGRAPQTSLAPAARKLSIGERMPNTKTEALELLGMGVATDSNLTSLKKIIDGLRMNWHPDLAADDSDRRTRELRLKQINAAWEILGGKSAGA